jgi:hypothetical protein
MFDECYEIGEVTIGQDEIKTKRHNPSNKSDSLSHLSNTLNKPSPTRSSENQKKTSNSLKAYRNPLITP